MSRHANPASVAPSVLDWALTRAKVTKAELARAVGTSETVVDDWFQGREGPSFRQARAIATRLRVPFGFLFLAEAPPEDLPIPDFRRIAGAPVDLISVDLRDVVLATLRKQAWLSEYLDEESTEPVAVVGRAKGDTSSSAVASDIRSSLGLSSVGTRPTTADAFLRDLVQRVERLGVNVLRSGVVGNNTRRPLSLDEFRGFALSDDHAPVIFINGVDAVQAQVFTLIHELAHIWRGESGISGGIDQLSLSVETWCNHVAADVLVPPAEFEQVWPADVSPDDAIRSLARHFRISRYVIAIRAFESGKVSRDELNRLLDEYRSEGRRSSASSGGDYYRTLIARNGRAFTGGLVEAVGTQRVLIRDAAGLLDAKPGQLSRLARELSGGG
jgi:Zn-dependent peptidase ImmA (M78 family)/transcriptional regulator with XRE-family HTH domain